MLASYENDVVSWSQRDCVRHRQRVLLALETIDEIFKGLIQCFIDWQPHCKTEMNVEISDEQRVTYWCRLARCVSYVSSPSRPQQIISAEMHSWQATANSPLYVIILLA